LSKYHSLFGRLYIIGILWCMASSLLIHNFGLAISIIVSFMYLLIGITVGLICIWFHSQNINEELNLTMQESLTKNPEKGTNLFKLKGEAMEKMLENKTFLNTFYSLKSLHGLLLTFSWYTMLGRLFVTDPSKFRGCVTYPAYKCAPNKLVGAQELGMYGGLSEINFIIMITVPAVVIILVVALITSYCVTKKEEQVEDNSKGLVDNKASPEKVFGKENLNVNLYGVNIINFDAKRTNDFNIDDNHELRYLSRQNIPQINEQEYANAKDNNIPELKIELKIMNDKKENE